MCVCQTLPRVSKSQTVCRIPKDKVFFLPIDSSSSFSRDLAQIYDAWRDLDKIAGKEGRTGGPDELVKKRGKPAGKTRLCVTSNIINSMQGIRRISPLRRRKYYTNYSRPPKKKGRKFLNWSQQSRQSRKSTSALCLAMARTGTPGRRLPYFERPGCEWAAFHNTMKSIDFAAILASKGQDIVDRFDWPEWSRATSRQENCWSLMSWLLFIYCCCRSFLCCCSGWFSCYFSGWSSCCCYSG